jgi:SAM-dependent methyltransferase
MPSETQLMKYYDTEYYGAPSKKFVGPVAVIVSWFQGGRARQVAKYVPQGGRILDVGCGNGGFLKTMQRYNFKVEGTEWTETSARRAAMESNLTVYAGDLLTLDLPRRRYDAISLWHVFEHLTKPFETLRLAYDLLDDSGVLFLSMPNHESWQARVFGTSWFHLDPPRHLFGFGPRSIRTALRLAGFEVDSCSTFSLEQNPFGFMQSFLNAAGFPRDRAYGVLKSTETLPKRTKILDLFLLSVLAIPGFVLSSIASVFGAGATMTIVARKGKAS